MIFPDAVIRKYKYENKDVINAQAFFHEVSTEVFKRRFLTVNQPHKSKEGESQPYPEQALLKCLFDADLSRLFTEYTQVNYDRNNQNNAKNKICQLMICH
jgi:hypothetical protein